MDNCGEHSCVDKPIGYTCNCKGGYKLANDSRSCVGKSFIFIFHFFASVGVEKHRGGEKHGSPMNLDGGPDEWVLSEFTWQEPSIPDRASLASHEGALGTKPK